MPRLSIIIPCLGGAADFDGTLVSVLQNRPVDCEVLVAHTEPYSDPYALQGEVHFVEVQADSLVELLNAALDATTGDVVHVLGCGLEASESWTSPALKHFDDREVAAVSPVVLAGDSRDVIAAGIRLSLGGARRVVADSRVISRGSGRLRAKILGPMLTAAFYRRDVLVALGGFEAALGDDLADAGLAVAMQSLGRLHVSEPASQLVRATDNSQPVASRFAAGQAAQRLFFRYAAVYGWLTSFALHTLTLVGEALRDIRRTLLPMSLLGRASAWLELGALRQYQQRLAAANDRLTELAELRASVRKAPRRAAPRIEASQSQRGSSQQQRRAA